MSPVERFWRVLAGRLRERAQELVGHADRYDLNADLQALREGLTLAEVESLQRLCGRDCPDALAAEGRG